MFRLRNIAMRDYKESVTTGQTDRQTPDKVIPMCRYASQATQNYAPPQVPNQAKAKRDGVINPQNYNFSQFSHLHLHHK